MVFTVRFHVTVEAELGENFGDATQLMETLAQRVEVQFTIHLKYQSKAWVEKRVANKFTVEEHSL